MNKGVKMENNYFVNILIILFVGLAVAVFGYVTYELFNVIDGFFVPLMLTFFFGGLLFLLLSVPCSIAITAISSVASHFLERKEKLKE